MHNFITIRLMTEEDLSSIDQEAFYEIVSNFATPIDVPMLNDNLDITMTDFSIYKQENKFIYEIPLQEAIDESMSNFIVNELDDIFDFDFELETDLK